MAPELEERIRRLYLGGMSLAQVGRQFEWMPLREIRKALDPVIRPRNHQRRKDPSEEEVVLAREETKAKWTPEQARLRWVGRYLSRTESLGSCLSQALRDLGGEG
jgi:hypothetical protein